MTSVWGPEAARSVLGGGDVGCGGRAGADVRVGGGTTLLLPGGSSRRGVAAAARRDYG